MPKKSHVQNEQTQTQTNTNPATDKQQAQTIPSRCIPVIDGRESASRYGVASLELTCFDCTVDDIVYRRDEIISSLRRVLAQAKEVVDDRYYEPMRRPIEYCATFIEPLSFGVCIDAGVVHDDDIVARADEIIAQLAKNFERLGNAQTRDSRGGLHG